MKKLPKKLTPQIKDGQAVKVIGLGGVGSIVARYGSIFLAALKTPCRMVLIDGDSFEPKNAARMMFAEYGNKADVVVQDILHHSLPEHLELTSVPEFVTPDNIDRLIRDGDIVILCLDNHASRKMVNEHAAKLDNVVLISGGNDGITESERGTFGNVQIYIRKDGKDVSHDLCKFHPEIANPKDKLPTDLSCTEALESTPQLMMANLAVASAILNALYIYLSGHLHYEEIAFDIADGWMRPQLDMPDEQLWREQKGINPVTGEMWLTERMENEAKELQKDL